LSRTFFSIGGGFIVADGEQAAPTSASALVLPYPFSSAAELLRLAAHSDLTIAELMLANESAQRSSEEVRSGILHIWSVMQSCIDRGIATEGILPGGLSVRRRAPRLARRLREKDQGPEPRDPLAPLD